MMRNKVSFFLVLAIIVSFSSIAFAYDAGNPTTTAPWYGVCNGNYVNIRRSASISSDSLAQINNNQSIEIVGVQNKRWYKVRYDENGNIGYIYSQYLTVATATYGRVLHFSGLDMKSSKGSTVNVTHVPYGNYMPYRELASYNNYVWADCVFGQTSGWVNSYNNSDFNYM